MSGSGMKRWENRVALVTGASDGTIGGAIAIDLVKNGMTVIGCARNVANVEKLTALVKGMKGKLIPYKCDLSKPEEIEKMFQWIDSNYMGVDVLINNAGVSKMKSILEIEVEDMRTQLDVNVIALTLCCKLAVNNMLKRGIKDGHVININSVLGHQVYGILNFYAATKWAVTALSEGLRKEIARKGSFIKVTQISPGRVETKFLYTSFDESEWDKVTKLYNDVESLTPNDVSDAVIHALSAGPHVQVQDIIFNPVQPTPAGVMK